MVKSKKSIINLIFLVAVFSFTVYSIFHGQDLSEILQKVLHTSPAYLLIGVVCVVIFIYGESYIIHYLLASLGIESKRFDCFLYSSAGFFFSCITPSASGGQPAQIYYMKKNDIPIPLATVILLVITIIYKFVLVVMGLFLMVFNPGFINEYLGDVLFVFYLGVGLNIFSVISMVILVFNQSLAKFIMLKGLRILEKLRILKTKPERMEKLSVSMDNYNKTAKYLKNHIGVMVKVFIVTFLQRIALFLAAYFAYRAFGLKGASIYSIIMLQAVISISVEMLPLPGGMGVSEGLFLSIFLPVFGPDLIVPGMILSRGLTYYTQLLLSAIMTCVAHITIGRKKHPELKLKSLELNEFGMKR